MPEEMTSRQIEILAFIAAFKRANGFPPTIREIGQNFRIAPPSVLSHLRALERKGVIKRIAFRPRCIEVIK